MRHTGRNAIARSTAMLACLLATAPAAEDRQASGVSSGDGASGFALDEAVRARIDPDRVDQALLDAAVCHETNRRRAEHRLPLLSFDEGARQVAMLHAEAMARHGFIGHRNPFDPALETPMDRARRAGLKPRFLAENVASAFVLEYAPGERAYLRTEDGRQIVSDRPDGAPIPTTTYAGFAESLLDGWMDSPGHRKNILHEAPQYVGCACAMLRGETLVEKAACAQVFFTPGG